MNICNIFRSLRGILSALVIAFGTTLPAVAATFTFELGDSTGGSTSRHGVELTMTVDPGTGGLINRTFFASDVIRLEYSWQTFFNSTSRSSYGLGLDDALRNDVRSGPLSFITTDASGRGTLGLSATGPFSVI